MRYKLTIGYLGAKLMGCFTRHFIAFGVLCGLIAACEPGPSSQAPVVDDLAHASSPISAQENGVDLWLEQMEVGSRELYAAREAVAAAVGLEEGAQIADIGAGTGLYTLLFAELAGATGHVYAVDIEPLFLDLINQRAADSGLKNVTAIYGREGDVTLPAGSIDVAFIADTYHYLSDREAIMKTVYEALRPGGKLVLVEYDITPGESRHDGKNHVRFGKATVIDEIEYVGFRSLGEVSVEGLEENYFVQFLKP